jgi:hypothetical protein
MPIDLQTLDLLSDKGVAFLIAVPNECGQRDYVATPEEVIEFCNDSVGFYAKIHGVTKSEYGDWLDDLFCVYCAAKTRAGRRCRNIVTGGNQVSPKRWVELQGRYCAVHGE